MSRYAVPCGIIAFCLGTFWLTTQFDRVPPILLRGMQPSDFPQLVLIVIMLMAGLVMLKREPSQPPAQNVTDESDAGDTSDTQTADPEPGSAPISPSVWRSMGLLLVFIAVAQVDLFLGLGVFAGALSMVWGERRWWALLIVMLIAPLCVFFLFDQVFEIRFPRGLLTELWYG